MDNNRVHIDDLFREGLRHHEVLPPANGWTSLKPRLLQRPALYLLRRAAAVAVVLIASSLTLWYVQRDAGNVLTDSSYQLNVDPLLAVAELPEPAPAIVRHAPVLFDQDEMPEPRIQEVTTRQRTSGVGNITRMQPEKSIDLPQQEAGLPLSVAGTGPSDGALLFNDLPGNLTDNGLLATIDALQPKNSKWSVGAQLSPTYSFRYLSVSNDDVQTDMLGNNEQPLLSYSGGVRMEYQLNDRLSVQTGVYYNSLGQQLNNIAVYEGFSVFTAAKSGSRMNVDYSGGGIQTNNRDIFLKDLAENRISTYYTADVFDPEKARLTRIGDGLVQNFQFLELPLIIRYKLIDRKMNIHVLGGLSTNFLVGNSTYTRTDTRKVEVGTTANLNTLNYSSTLGLGMEYQLSDRVTFNLEPVLKYYLNPLNQTNYISLHPYSFGVYSGLNYNF